MNVLAFIVLFGVLVFFHELGHFLAAKALGVKVLRFSIGFGPRLLGFERQGTEYWIAALPLGGYVKMAGQDPTAEVAPEDAGRGFYDQPPARRLLISLAGPLFNLVLALAVYGGAYATLTGSNVVGTVIPETPAAAAGLRSGDRILSVAAPGQAPQPVRYFMELRERVSPHAGEELVLEVERDGRRLPPVTIRPAADSDENAVGERVQRGYIGVLGWYPSPAVAPVRPGAAGPVQPLDVVVKAGGRSIRNGVELSAALSAAACAPLDLEVLRPAPSAGRAAPAPSTRLSLPAVPTCAGGAPTLLLADPYLAPVVSEVEPGGPAAAAGLRRGDIIRTVAGKPVRNVLDLNALSERGVFAPGTPVPLELADGRTVTLVPAASKGRAEAGTRSPSPVIGFGFSDAGVDRRTLLPQEVPVRFGLGDLATKSWGALVDAVRLVVTAVARFSFKDVAGPIGLFRVTSVVMEQGGWEAFVQLLAVVSVNVGLLNLLPIPILDGGNIGQALVEMIMRRTLSLRTRAITNVVGLVVILAFFSVVFWKDIEREIRIRADHAAQTQRP